MLRFERAAVEKRSMKIAGGKFTLPEGLLPFLPYALLA
jgi:hypothetical protein